MAYFPFFIDIENKKGLIVGGGRIAAHKAEKVKPFGVKITIIAPDIMDKLKPVSYTHLTLPTILRV